jgi:phosphoglycolate phosphatase-like HAD superfamily hydrolase
MRLFLFDIDGTLINAHGVGHRALVYAMETVFGTPGDHEAYDWRGKTDRQIVREILRQAGVSDSDLDARLDECFEVYRRKLAEQLGNGHPVTVLPGIPDLLERLSRRDDCLVGLLTGNDEPGAWTKLGPTGLSPYFRVGAFGTDDMDRRQLPSIARRRAESLIGREIPWSEVWVIGDTPLDVDCARANGAVAVAVATGFHPYEDLVACAPDALFTDFSDVEASLARLMQPVP